MPNKEVARQTLHELRSMKEGRVFQASPEIDMVWIISGPGTIKNVSHDGIYAETSADQERFLYGTQLMKQITAARLNKDISGISKSDIAEHGPTLYYNGEDKKTVHGQYLQNEDLVEASSHADFPIPQNKIIIDTIPSIGTHQQVIGFAHFLQRHSEIRKIAVVSHVSHAIRVGRFIEHYKNLFPDYVILLNACVPDTGATVGKVLREVKKVVKYTELGWLSEKNYFEKKSEL